MDANNYRIIAKLDSGGMAEVFKAELETVKGFKKIVAIKRIRPNLAKDKSYINMFMDEARLSLYLQHANIASVFDVGMSGEHFFIVMEYIEGMNLRALMELLPSSALPVQIAVKIVGEICEALDYAHALKHPESGEPLHIVHRDISPPNILISKQGEVKLVDFGLAKASVQVEKSEPGIIKGKFSYLSPEAASGVEVDHRTDIFAAGIILYELITGERLFKAEDDYHTVLKVQEAKIPPLATKMDSVPNGLEPILLKALQRDPDSRYQTAGDMYEDLTQFLFSYGKAVTKRDISGLLEKAEERKASENSESSESFLSEIIEEELANLISLGDADDEIDLFSDPGAAPIETDTLNSAGIILEKYTPSGIKQVSEPSQLTTLKTEPHHSETAHSESAARVMEPVSFMKEDSDDSSLLKTVLMFSGLLAVIAALVFWLFI